MDLKSSPVHLHLNPVPSPEDTTADDNIDQLNDNDISESSPDRDELSQSPTDMATTLVAHHPPGIGAGVAGVGKRYRPAPAKTFQCRGYGECRMVFSRSEHLARHIRKHTGERPFTCHCGKQFSRLDNLRQHAQTVHADKQDQNERMMRDLTSLHATMAAANKSGHPRSKRSNNASSSQGSSSVSPPINGDTSERIKQEDVATHSFRPGTSTGYEGDHNGIVYQGTTWHVQTSNMDHQQQQQQHARSSASNHCFRAPGQSFLVPQSSPSHLQHHHHHQQQHHSEQPQSFLGLSSQFSFSLPPAGHGRPGSSHSRPPTAGNPDAHHRTLPPLSAVVPTSLSSAPPPPQPPTAAAPQQPTSSSPSFPIAHNSTQLVLPLPGSTHAFGRRPSTATRPGTAPASYFAPKPPYVGGPGLAARPDLGYGRSGIDMGLVTGGGGGYEEHATATTTTTSNISPGYDSPFSFHPPAISSDVNIISAAPTTTNNNPRKRPFPGADGPDDGGEYDYGSESRPQSRRLSVMELCNDTDADAGVGQFIPHQQQQQGASRPTTSSGLVTSASALALVDRNPAAAAAATSPSLLARAAHAAAGAVAAAAGGGGGAAEYGGGRVSPSSRRFPSSATAASTPSPTTVFSPYRGSSFAALSDGTASSASSTSSPRSSPRSPFGRSTGFQQQQQQQHQSASPAAASPDSAVPRRGGSGDPQQHDQVRITVSPHSSAVVGMRV